MDSAQNVQRAGDIYRALERKTIPTGSGLVEGWPPWSSVTNGAHRSGPRYSILKIFTHITNSQHIERKLLRVPTIVIPNHKNGLKLHIYHFRPINNVVEFPHLIAYNILSGHSQYKESRQRIIYVVSTLLSAYSSAVHILNRCPLSAYSSALFHPHTHPLCACRCESIVQQLQSCECAYSWN